MSSSTTDLDIETEKLNPDLKQYYQDFDSNYYQSMTILSDMIKKGDTLDRDNMMFVHCGLSIPFFNNLYVTDPSQIKNMPWQGADSFFRDRDLDYQIVLSDEYCESIEDQLISEGYVKEGCLPAMVFDSKYNDLPKPSIYDQVRIERVVTEKQHLDFKSIITPAFGMVDFVSDRIITSDFAFYEGHELYIAYLDDQPVSTSLLFISHGVAGIYWVATDETMRGKGLGEAVAYHATLEGLKLGCRFASLQATELGAPVYQKLGYRKLYTYNKYTKKIKKDT